MSAIFELPEDSMELLIWVLEFSGHLKTEKFSFLNRLMMVIGAVFTLNGWICPWIYAFTSEGSIQQRGEMFVYATGGLHICTKFFNILLRQEETRRILKLTQSFWDKKKNQYSDEVKNLCDKRCKNAMRMLFGILNSLTLLVILKGVIINIGKGPDERMVPYPCWTPLDLREWFFTNSIWEVFTLFIDMFNVSVSYSFLYVTIIQASSQMKILSSRLESNTITPKEAIQQHIKIISLVKHLNELCAAQMALEIFLDGLEIAASGYSIMKLIHSHAGFAALAFSCYAMLLYISFSYLACLGGQEITVQSEELFVSIYQSEWYKMSLDDQKCLSVMLCLASKSLRIRYNNLVIFSMERYAQMMQATYSYLTILSGMDL